MSVRAIYSEEKHIGEKIKKSKTQFIWKFELDGLQHQIEFLVSKFTGKKRVIQDGVILLEQQKLSKNFSYPFNIGKHMCVISYGLKGAGMRIDNNAFDDLYQTKSFGGKASMTNHRKAPGSSKPSAAVGGRKKMPEGWVDIQKAKDSVKYDDIPDPYSDKVKIENKKEEKKEEKQKISLKDLGRGKKSGTVFKKNKDEFFDNDDDFNWDSNKNKNKEKGNDFDFDFGNNTASNENKKSDAFDFDSFGENLPKKKEDDIFGDGGSTTEPAKKTGIEDIVFDSSNYAQAAPPQPKTNDVFGGAFHQPAPVAAPANPFDAFGVANNAPPSQHNANFGGNQTDWNAGFSSQFSSTPFSGAGSFNTQGITNTTQKSDFASLNPFPNNQAEQQNVLPPGVNGLDLFD
eukprot:CAMPEP_0205819996 /NCGR_PEP_ID=MMETSP0206-20130828/2564_1 /ASSEMBLY_ACC=CAM_ASM_000279 /TAXON_ID=36767 /ORGANISM="Euplotes focardii, Strain TN1" /LENGTH=400 /DNA_ID=CAMNT_0053114259 /DNA_START=26 /DNA_END=1228 /DNA_ORIENTATION=-